MTTEQELDSQTCQHCRYSAVTVIDSGTDVGEPVMQCLRYPPQAVLGVLDEATGPEIILVNPQVAGAGWCGEWVED